MNPASTPLELFGAPRGWLTMTYRKRLIDMLVIAQAESFRRDFPAWLSENYEVWLAFEHEGNRLWARGIRHYGARTIVEWLRHESSLREGPNEHGWKLNNNFIPDLARLYMMMWPDRAEFFEKRVNPLSVRSQ